MDIMVAMKFYNTYNVLQESTATKSRNKQAREPKINVKHFHSKQSAKKNKRKKIN